MLVGYYIVLSVPLLIVVPYAAFRSLAGEWEDGTFELLSITTLSARQIVAGKLASAVLQMMVYYSALAPCIAFTYLLRGIDIVTVALLLGYSFAASLLLSSFGLMMATVTRVRHWQVLLSVVLVMALLVFTFVWDMAFIAFLIEGETMPLDQPEFWIAHLCGLTFLHPRRAAAAVRRRRADHVCQRKPLDAHSRFAARAACLLVGWFVYLWHRVGHESVLYTMIFIAGVYWTDRRRDSHRRNGRAFAARPAPAAAELSRPHAVHLAQSGLGHGLRLCRPQPGDRDADRVCRAGQRPLARPTIGRRVFPPSPARRTSPRGSASAAACWATSPAIWA